jgi:hypothetical protein
VPRGESAEFEVEACDAQGHLALPYELSYQPNLAKKRKAIGSLNSTSQLSGGTFL